MTDALARCPSCGRPVPSGVGRDCPHCGASLQPAPAPIPTQAMSYSEKYAGTEYGRPQTALAPSPTPARPPRKGLVLPLRIAVSVVGLALLVPGAIGVALDTYLLLGGFPDLWALITASAGVAAGRIGVALTLVWYLFWGLLGLKILAAPGRASLGCAGLSALPGFIAAGLLLLLAGPTSGVNAVATWVLLLFTGFMVVVSFTARSEMG